MTSRIQAWNVYNRGGYCIDTVFFDADMTADEVLRSLIEHDGYSYSIRVRKA